MSPSAAPPPSPQEVQRKLSVHSAAKPKKPTPPPPSTSAPSQAQAHVSGTESDSDSILSPDLVSPASHSLASSGAMIPGSCSLQPPLSSIAERRSGSGGEETEEEDEEDEEGWRSGEVLASMDEECVIKSGYLWKKGERRKTWKKRWFVLRSAHLAYYKTSAEYKPLRLLDLSDVHSCMPVVLKKHTYTFGVVLAVRTFYLQAQSPEEVQDWVKAIQDAREALLMSSARTSLTTTPIPIPRVTPSSERHALLTPSPPHAMNTHAVTSSDSEDGSPHAQRVLSSSPQTLATMATTANVSSSPGRGQTPKDGGSKVVLSGYLTKCGSKRHNWRKRWFTLSSERLIYSGSHMDTKPHRQFAVSEILDALEFDMRSHKHSAGAPPPAGSPVPSSSHADKQNVAEGRHTFKIVTTKRTLLLCAPSEEEEIKWLSAIRALIARRTGAGVVPGSTGERGEGVHVGGSSGGGGLRHKVRNLSISGPSGGTSATEER